MDKKPFPEFVPPMMAESAGDHSWLMFGLLDDQKRKPVTATDYSRLFRAVNSL